MKKQSLLLWVAPVLLAAFASAGFSAEMKDMKKKEVAPAVDAKMAQDAKMAEMMKLSSPGENHKVLDMFSGNWNYSVRFWMAPDLKPEESKGTSASQWILGGRFVQQNVKGTAMGQPFEGIGMIGYDNMKKEYQTLWIDNMTTGFMTGTSLYDAASKTFAETGSFSCPMTGEAKKPFRGVMKISDPNNYTYVMYQNAPDGKEFKAMEIVYTRAPEPKKAQ